MRIIVAVFNKLDGIVGVSVQCNDILSRYFAHKTRQAWEQNAGEETRWGMLLEDS